jgi:capping protein beta
MYFSSRIEGGGELTEAAVQSNAKSTGTWDSIHVFEALDRARICHYKLTSTVILNMVSSGDELGEMDLSGNMTRQVESDLVIDDEGSHVVNIGRMVEDMEMKMRNLLQEVYFGKAKDVVGDLRSKWCYQAWMEKLLTGYRYCPCH